MREKSNEVTTEKGKAGATKGRVDKRVGGHAKAKWPQAINSRLDKQRGDCQCKRLLDGSSALTAV